MPETRVYNGIISKTTHDGKPNLGYSEAWETTLLPAFLKESLSAVVHQAIRRKEDGCWIAATSHGLYVQPFPESLSMQRMLVQDALGRQWATHDVLGITQDSLGRLWFATEQEWVARPLRVGNFIQVRMVCPIMNSPKSRQAFGAKCGLGRPRAWSVSVMASGGIVKEAMGSK